MNHHAVRLLGVRHSFAVCLSVLAVACSSDGGGSDATEASGGSVTTGGTTGASSSVGGNDSGLGGGTLGVGGAITTGGSGPGATGGSPSAGGAPSTGGVTGVGGASNSGGNTFGLGGRTSASGGSVGTGGATGIGGTSHVSGSGGEPQGGGHTGGNPSTGGVTGTGGAAPTGGTTGIGGTGPGVGGRESSGGASSSDGGSSPTGGASTGQGGTSAGGFAGHVDAGGSSATGGGSASDGGSGGSGEYSPCPTNGDPCKILPFGDSITNGVASSDLGGYRSKLFGLIVAANQKVTFTGSQSSGPNQVSGVDFPQNHEGRSGWTIDPGFSSYGSGGISDLVPSPAFDTMPNIVLLMIGTNDVYAESGTDQIAERLESLLDAIVDTAPDALIVVAEITPLGWASTVLDNYNAQIPGIVEGRAAAGQHMIAVDMSQMPISDLASDDVHPNDAGYAYMADVWYAAIGEFLPQ